MLAYDTRVNMLDLFVADLNTPNVLACVVEHQIAADDKPIFTWDLLTHFERKYPKEYCFSFAIGPDNKVNWHKFIKPKKYKTNGNRFFCQSESLFVHRLCVTQ